MAHEPMTLDEIRATRPKTDPTKIAATTEENIRQHQIEDGEDPDAPLPLFRPTPNVRAIQTQFPATQREFAEAISVFMAAVRDLEQFRTSMNPAVRSLLRVVKLCWTLRCGRWRSYSAIDFQAIERPIRMVM